MWRLITWLAFCWWWRKARRQERSSEAERSAQALADILLAQASAHLHIQLGDSDALDLKALGLITVDVGAITVLAATSGSLNGTWWLSAALFALSALCFCEVVRTRSFAVGPEFPKFYGAMRNASPRAISEQMLSELLEALDQNNNIHLPRKVRAFKWGLRILLVAALGALVVIVTRP